jgi:hypothetical protein
VQADDMSGFGNETLFAQVVLSSIARWCMHLPFVIPSTHLD